MPATPAVTAMRGRRLATVPSTTSAAMRIAISVRTTASPAGARLAHTVKDSSPSITQRFHETTPIALVDNWFTTRRRGAWCRRPGGCLNVRGLAGDQRREGPQPLRVAPPSSAPGAELPTNSGGVDHDAWQASPAISSRPGRSRCSAGSKRKHPAQSGGAAAPVDAPLAIVINRWPAHPPSVALDQCHRKLVPVSTRAFIKEPRDVENESRGIRRAGADRAAGEADSGHRAA